MLPSETEQVLCSQERPANVVAPEVMTGLLVDDRPPDDEMRFGLGQRFELFAIGHVVPVTEQDNPVGPMAGFVPAMPVSAQLLERYEYIVIDGGGGARDAAEHRQEERSYLGVVGRRVLEQEQCDRAALAGAQPGRVLVDPVVELRRDVVDSLPRFRTHERAVAQGPRHRRLRHAGFEGNVPRCGFRCFHFGSCRFARRHFR